MNDPYIYLENLDDPKVIEWAMRLDSEFRRVYEDLSLKLFPRVLKYLSVPVVTDVDVIDKGMFVLVRENTYRIEYVSEDRERRLLVDSGSLGEDAVIHSIYASNDGKRLAYKYSLKGRDEGVLRIIDPESMELIDELHGVISDVIWVSRGKYYYVRSYRSGVTPDGVKAPAERVFLRKEEGDEEMVFGKGLGTNYMISLVKSHEKVLAQVSYGWLWSDIYAWPLDSPHKAMLIRKGDGKLQYPMGYNHNGYFIISYDDAEGMGRVVRVDDHGEKIVVKERDMPLRYGVVCCSNLIALYLENASSKIVFYDLNGSRVSETSFPYPKSVKHVDNSDKRLVIVTESFIEPYTIYLYEGHGLKHLESYKLRLDISVSEGWARSSDGTPIHYFVVKRRTGDTSKVLLYGYGGFGIPLTPMYSGSLIPFIEDGGTVVVANLRGGSEYGEKWHHAGMKHNKMNVFEDFAAIARVFKTRNARIVAMGSSNGGLLVAATTLLYPELFDAAVIGYPVLDMLRFHKLYIGRAWVPEYGDPENPEDREYLLKYSPYHNIDKSKDYPPMLVFTGLHDDRVHPAHAFKFVAKMLEYGKKVYLRVERASGHAGASVKVKAKESSDILAFIYRALSIEEKLNG